MTQLDLFTEAAPAVEPYVPGDDSPFCQACRFFTDKVIPLGERGGWVGHAGDCSKHGCEVLTYAYCEEFAWVSEAEKSRHENYLRRVGRG